MKPRITLAVAVFGTFLVLVAYCVTIGALEATARSLNASVAERAWIASGMSVGLAAALLPSGALADALGRRRVFVLGAALFAGASAIAGLARDSTELVAARILQGIAGAALTSCSLGILGTTFPNPAERTRATALWGASLGAGIAVGPVVATSLPTWRESHDVCAVASVALVAAAWRGLPESRHPNPRGLDLLGAALWSAGLSALLIGLIEGRRGLFAPTALGATGAGVVLLAAFVFVQAKRRAPMLHLQLFRRADFSGATIGAFVTGTGMISLASFVPTMAVVGLQARPLAASLVLLGWSVPSVLLSIAARRLPESVSARTRLIGGLLGVSAGQALLLGVDRDTSLLRVAGALVVAGVFTGVLNATFGRQAVASVPAGSEAMGSGANNTARYLGAAIGVTVMTLLLRRGGELLPNWTLATAVTIATTLAGALAIALLPRRIQPTTGQSTSVDASRGTP